MSGADSRLHHVVCSSKLEEIVCLLLCFTAAANQEKLVSSFYFTCKLESIEHNCTILLIA
jgi:hypothetical protein